MERAEWNCKPLYECEDQRLCCPGDCLGEDVCDPEACEEGFVFFIFDEDIFGLAESVDVKFCNELNELIVDFWRKVEGDNSDVPVELRESLLRLSQEIFSRKRVALFYCEVLELGINGVQSLIMMMIHAQASFSENAEVRGEILDFFCALATDFMEEIDAFFVHLKDGLLFWPESDEENLGLPTQQYVLATLREGAQNMIDLIEDDEELSGLLDFMVLVRDWVGSVES